MRHIRRWDGSSTSRPTFFVGGRVKKNFILKFTVIYHSIWKKTEKKQIFNIFLAKQNRWRKRKRKFRLSLHSLFDGSRFEMKPFFFMFDHTQKDLFFFFLLFLELGLWCELVMQWGFFPMRGNLLWPGPQNRNWVVQFWA